MKIVYFITKSYWGGAAKYVIDLASGLDPKENEIYIAAGGKEALFRRAEEQGINYIEIPHFGRKISVIGDVLSFFEVLATLYKIKPDVIHVNSSKAGGVCGAAGFVYRILGNLPTRTGKLEMIFTAHGWAFHESRPKFQLFLIRLFSRLTCKFYDKIICITSIDYNAAIRYKIAPKKKLELIPNGINSEDLKFLTKKEAQEKLFGKNKSLVIGTVGEWVHNKGWDILLKAIEPLLEKYVDITLALIAGGESPHKKEITHEKIIVIENLQDAHKYLKAFDIFVFPSRKEGLAYALLEASLAELPIIASAVGGNFDIIDSLKTGVLFHPGDHDMLRTFLDKFIQNLPNAKKLGKSAREKVEKKFSIHTMREKTYKLYYNKKTL